MVACLGAREESGVKGEVEVFGEVSVGCGWWPGKVATDVWTANGLFLTPVGWRGECGCPGSKTCEMGCDPNADADTAGCVSVTSVVCESG